MLSAEAMTAGTADWALLAVRPFAQLTATRGHRREGEKEKEEKK